MIDQATLDDLKRTLAAERQRKVSDAEVQEVLDYLYALADLIFEDWQEKQVERKNKLNHNTNDHDDHSGI